MLGALIVSRWAALAVLSAIHWLRQHRRSWPEIDDTELPPVAVVIPAYNEERVLEGAVRSALSSDYPDLRVIVVDDGSTDGTAAVAEGLSKDPRVSWVAQRPNQGKPAALDAGLAEARTDLVITVDADTVLARDAVRRLVRPLLGDPGLAAVAGNVKVGNRTTVLSILQSLEYVVGLNLGRRAQDVLGCITTVPGAAAAWRRAAIEQVGGVPDATRIEDTDLTIRVQRAGWRVTYAPDAVALTEAPQTLRGLVAQRTRWIGGYIRVIGVHRGAFFEGGSLGLLGMPDLLYRNVLAFVMLPLVIPGIVRLIQSFSLLAFVEFFLGLVLLDTIATALAYAEDRERWTEVLWSPVRRIVWPWILGGILVRVLWLELRRGDVGWAKVTRRGELALTSEDEGGPRVLR